MRPLCPVGGIFLLLVPLNKTWLIYELFLAIFPRRANKYSRGDQKTIKVTKIMMSSTILKEKEEQK